MTLPPGTYTIQSQENPPRGVVCPKSLGSGLQLADPDTTKDNQLWTIATDGSIRSETSTTYAYVDINSLRPTTITDVISSDSSIFWVFGLPWGHGGSEPYSYTIYTQDSTGEKYYWGCDSTSANIPLPTESYGWTFTPVS